MSLRVTDNRPLSPPSRVSQGDEGPSFKRAKTERAGSSSSSSLSSSAMSFAGSFQPPSPDRDELVASYEPIPTSPRSPQRTRYDNLGDVNEFINTQRLGKCPITAQNLSEIKAKVSGLLLGTELFWVKGMLYLAYGEALRSSLEKEKNAPVMAELLDCLEKGIQVANESGSLTAIGEQLHLQADCHAACQTFPKDFIEPFRGSLKNPQDLYRMALEKFHENEGRRSSISVQEIQQHIQAIEYAVNSSSPFPQIRSLAQRNPPPPSSSSSHPSDPLFPLPRFTSESLPPLEGPASVSLTGAGSSAALSISDGITADLTKLFDVFKRLKVEDISAVKKKIEEIAKKLTLAEMYNVHNEFAKAVGKLYRANRMNPTINGELIHRFECARKLAYATDDNMAIAKMAHETGLLYAFICSHLPKRGIYHTFTLSSYEEAIKNLKALQEADPTKKQQCQEHIQEIEKCISLLKNHNNSVPLADTLISQFQKANYKDLKGLKSEMFIILPHLPRPYKFMLYFNYINALIRLYPTNKNEWISTEISKCLGVLEASCGELFEISSIAFLKGRYQRVVHNNHAAARALFQQAKGILVELEKNPSHKKDLVLLCLRRADEELSLLRPASPPPPVPHSILSLATAPEVNPYILAVLAEPKDRVAALGHYRRALEGAVGPLKASIEAAIKRLTPR